MNLGKERWLFFKKDAAPDNTINTIGTPDIFLLSANPLLPNLPKKRETGPFSRLFEKLGNVVPSDQPMSARSSGGELYYFFHPLFVLFFA